MSKARQLADLLDSNGDVVVGALDNAPDPDLTNYATTTYVANEVANLVGSSPATLDTLNELATALGNDPNFATTVTNNIAAKASVSYVDAEIAANSGGGVLKTIQVLNSSGTFTVPSGVTEMFVVAIGGGGGSGKRSAGSTSGGDNSVGGNGGLSSNFVTGLTPGGTISYTVGNGGNGSNGGNGASGGTTTFSSVSAGGGGGGRGGSNVNNSGQGNGATGSSSGIYTGDANALRNSVLPNLTLASSATIFSTRDQINGDTGGAGNANGTTYTLGNGILAGDGASWSSSSAYRGTNGAIFLFY